MADFKDSAVPLAELRERWIDAATRHHRGTMDGEPEECNRAVAELSRLSRILHQREGGLDLLEDIARTQGAEVAVMTAVYMGDSRPDVAVPILRRHARRKDILGLGAEYALKRWESGERFLDE